MNVRQLIEKLLLLDQELPVVTDSCCEDGNEFTFAEPSIVYLEGMEQSESLYSHSKFERFKIKAVML